MKNPNDQTTKSNASQKLRQALMELIKSKDVDALTVKEVAERAGVARRTFYHCYVDLPDLMHHILTDVSSDIIEQSIKAGEPEDIIYIFTDVLNEYYPMLRNVMGSRFRRDAEYGLLEATKTILLEVFRGRHPGRAEEIDTSDFYVDAYACMVCTYLLEHFEKRDLDPEAIRENISSELARFSYE